MFSWVGFVFLLSHLSGPCYLQSDFRRLLPNDTHYSSLAPENSSHGSNNFSLASHDLGSISDGFNLAPDVSSLTPNDSIASQDDTNFTPNEFIISQDDSNLTPDESSLISDVFSLVSNDSVRTVKDDTNVDPSLFSDNSSHIPNDPILIPDNSKLVPNDSSVVLDDQSLVPVDFTLVQNESSFVPDDSNLATDDSTLLSDLIPDDSSVISDDSRLVLDDSVRDYFNRATDKSSIPQDLAPVDVSLVPALSNNYDDDVPHGAESATEVPQHLQPFPEQKINTDCPLPASELVSAADDNAWKPFPPRDVSSSQQDIGNFGPELPSAAEGSVHMFYHVLVQPAEWYPYVWNKTEQSAADFLFGFCPNLCENSSANFINLTQVEENTNSTLAKNKGQERCVNAECFYCKCLHSKHVSQEENDWGEFFNPTNLENNSFCGIGNCCPTREEMDDARARKAGEHIGCLNQINPSFVIMRCPADTTNHTLRDACHYGRGEFTVDEPVTDTETNVTYRNEHCARCHGVRSSTPWPLYVSCQHFQYLYHVTSEVKLLEKIQQEDISGCSVLHIPPSSIPQIGCAKLSQTPMTGQQSVLTSPQHSHLVQNFNNIITACNVTGLWVEFDADVQAGCAEFTRLSFRVVTEDVWPNQMYANLFCAMCNGFQPKWQYCEHQRTSPEFPQHPLDPLTFLLGLKDRREDSFDAQQTTCAPGQWFALNNECRNLSCPAGKSLNETKGTCNTALKMVKGLEYHMDILLLPEQSLLLTAPGINDSHVVSMFRQTLMQTFKNKTGRLLESYWLTFSIDTRDFNTSGGMHAQGCEIVGLKLSGIMKATIFQERDEVEEALVNALLLEDWALFIEMSGDIVYFNPSPHHDVLDVENNASYRLSAEISMGLFDYDIELLRNDFAGKPRIQLTRLLLCPFVEFHLADVTAEQGNDFKGKINDNANHQSHSIFSVTEEEQSPLQGRLKKVGGQWRAVLMGREVSLVDAQFSWQLGQDGRLVICVDTLQELLTRHTGPRAGSSFWHYALSMAAIPLSILCLLLLLLIYALLPELRTQPGLNTMGTCSSLLVAQLSLLLASHRIVSGAWCTALGILVHISWLTTFCWTSVCSVHMYRAFSCMTDRRCKRRNYRMLARNSVVTLLLPGAVVASVVGVSWQQSAGQSLGYSSVTCYLRSPLLVGLSVVLPLSLMVAFNLVLYSLTVYRIQQVSQLQARAESETESGGQHVRACLRLSLLTGVTWLFSLLSESLDLHWLRLVSILANGGQGLLLLLSYVTTKRVALMLMTRLGCVDDVTRGSSTGHCSVGISEHSESRVRSSFMFNPAMGVGHQDHMPRSKREDI